MTSLAEAREGRRSSDWYDENPHARFSFSRYATFARCPAWFRHEYLDWHKTPVLPVLRVGNAVERVLLAVFDREPKEEYTSLEELEAAARRGIDHLFDRAFDAAAREHAEDPGAVGSFDELDRARYRDYTFNGLRLHMREVKARLERRHPRTGAALELPEVGLNEAWSTVRPWHADTKAENEETLGQAEETDFDASMERVPGGFFQGQYDLVYSWTGGRRIVDLKASSGASAFSSQIHMQLAFYAWMERELGRGRPEGLEGWFLGRKDPLLVPVPDDPELDALEEKLHALIETSGSERGFGEWDPGDFPADPADVPNMAPEGEDPSAWCSACPARGYCPRITERVLEGVVAGIARPRERSKKKPTRRFTIINPLGAQSLSWDADVVQALIDAGMRAGQAVRLRGLRVWKHPASGNELLYPTPMTRVELLNAATR